MRTPVIWILWTLCLLGSGCVTGNGQPAPWTGAREFQIDPVHSAVTFEIDHLGTSRAQGRFNQFSGELAMDHDDPSACRIRVSVDAASLDTNAPKRDEHLRSEDFFHVAQHPTITFVSSHFDAVGKGSWDVTGVLTLLGKTRPVTAQVNYVGSSNTERLGARSGYRGTFTILRSDFGMSIYVDNGMLGDAVDITVDVEGIAR